MNLCRFECRDGCCVIYFKDTPRFVYHYKSDGILRIDNYDGSARYLTWWESIKFKYELW